MQLKYKSILIFSAITLITITTSTIASCTANNNFKSSSINTIILQGVINDHGYGKYTLDLKVNKAYMNHYITVSLIKETSLRSDRFIISNKTLINDKETTTIHFTNLDPNTKYIIKEIAIYKKPTDSKPLIVETPKTKKVLKLKKYEEYQQQIINNQLFSGGFVYKENNKNLVYKKNG